MTKGRQRISPPRIMVVDDDKDILAVIKRGLEVDDKFKAEIYSSGEAALKAFEAHPDEYYDLILTDIRMPKMNGFELYRHIKEKNSLMKIAFITAFEINKDEFNKVLPSVNVIDFISKPISTTGLIKKIKSILAGHPENPAA